MGKLIWTGKIFDRLVPDADRVITDLGSLVVDLFRSNIVSQEIAVVSSESTQLTKQTRARQAAEDGERELVDMFGKDRLTVEADAANSEDLVAMANGLEVRYGAEVAFLGRYLRPDQWASQVLDAMGGDLISGSMDERSASPKKSGTTVSFRSLSNDDLEEVTLGRGDSARKVHLDILAMGSYTPTITSTSLTEEVVRKLKTQLEKGMLRGAAHLLEDGRHQAKNLLSEGVRFNEATDRELVGVSIDFATAGYANIPIRVELSALEAMLPKGTDELTGVIPVIDGPTDYAIIGYVHVESKIPKQVLGMYRALMESKTKHSTILNEAQERFLQIVGKKVFPQETIGVFISDAVEKLEIAGRKFLKEKYIPAVQRAIETGSLEAPKTSRPTLILRNGVRKLTSEDQQIKSLPEETKPTEIEEPKEEIPEEPTVKKYNPFPEPTNRVWMGREILFSADRTLASRLTKITGQLVGGLPYSPENLGVELKIGTVASKDELRKVGEELEITDLVNSLLSATNREEVSTALTRGGPVKTIKLKRAVYGLDIITPKNDETTGTEGSKVRGATTRYGKVHTEEIDGSLATYRVIRSALQERTEAGKTRERGSELMQRIDPLKDVPKRKSRSIEARTGKYKVGDRLVNDIALGRLHSASGKDIEERDISYKVLERKGNKNCAHTELVVDSTILSTGFSGAQRDYMDKTDSPERTYAMAIRGGEIARSNSGEKMDPTLLAENAADGKTTRRWYARTISFTPKELTEILGEDVGLYFARNTVLEDGSIGIPIAQIHISGLVPDKEPEHPGEKPVNPNPSMTQTALEITHLGRGRQTRTWNEYGPIIKEWERKDKEYKDYQILVERMDHGFVPDIVEKVDGAVAQIKNELAKAMREAVKMYYSK